MTNNQRREEHEGLIESLNRVRRIVSEENADTMSNDELLDACIDLAASRELTAAPPSERLEATMASLRQSDRRVGGAGLPQQCAARHGVRGDRVLRGRVRFRRARQGSPAVKNVNARSKTGRWWQTPEGATRRHQHIPLGHAAAVMIDQDGNAFEVENVRTHDAGSGVTALFEIRAVTGERIQVGSNLLSASDTNPEVHVGADNLRATVRAGRRRFDAEARWTEPDGLEDVGIRHVRRPQRRSAAPGWRMTADRRGGGRPAERAVRDKDGGAATDRRSRVPQRHPARHGVRSDAALRDRIRAQGPSRVGEPIQGESTEHALEGSASGGSPRRCNRLHPARARRDGDIDRDDPAVEVENVRAGGRSPRSTCNDIASCRTGEAEPGVTGRTPSSRQSGSAFRRREPAAGR